MQNMEHSSLHPTPISAPPAKPLKWQMRRPPERLHLAPAVDIFRVNIWNDSIEIIFLKSSLPKLYQDSQINSRMTSDFGRIWVLKWKSQITLKRNPLWPPDHIAKPPITQLRLSFGSLLSFPAASPNILEQDGPSHLLVEEHLHFRGEESRALGGYLK